MTKKTQTHKRYGCKIDPATGRFKIALTAGGAEQKYYASINLLFIEDGKTTY
jgi:hypothetical protein